MKKPDDVAVTLARQWQRADLREQRLRDDSSVWPLHVRISKPAAKEITQQTAELKKTLDQWRSMKIGNVQWQQVRYRGLADELEIPVIWEIPTAADWIRAINRPAITDEFNRLRRILAAVDPVFHRFFCRHKNVLTATPTEELINCAKVAGTLSPACATGIPLRSISVGGIDTKFLERNRSVVTRLLDIRFDESASKLGLEGFLGATGTGEHWLLAVDLDGQLLPAAQIRVRASELKQCELPCERLLVVENEQCLHLIPQLKGTIAILGAGLDLNWLYAEWITRRSVAYWGDIDTWGLRMLATARERQPGLTAILMTRGVFDQLSDKSAVAEENTAGKIAPDGLIGDEYDLYEYLLSVDRGRLEQEFLGRCFVEEALQDWIAGTAAFASS